MISPGRLEEKTRFGPCHTAGSLSENGSIRGQQSCLQRSWALLPSVELLHKAVLWVFSPEN